MEIGKDQPTDITISASTNLAKTITEGNRTDTKIGVKAGAATTEGVPPLRTKIDPDCTADTVDADRPPLVRKTPMLRNDRKTQARKSHTIPTRKKETIPNRIPKGTPRVVLNRRRRANTTDIRTTLKTNRTTSTESRWTKYPRRLGTTKATSSLSLAITANTGKRCQWPLRLSRTTEASWRCSRRCRRRRRKSKRRNKNRK